MKKILFVIILNLLIFSGSKVFAVCYEVRDAHSSQLIEYTKDNSSYQDSSKYKVTFVSDSSCKTFYDKQNYVSCGKIGKFNKKIPEITSWLLSIVEIVIPVLLAIFGAIDFVKSIVSQKEDEINKSKSIFLRRVITAALIFFFFFFCKVVVSLFSSGSSESDSIINCIDCFMSNKCS